MNCKHCEICILYNCDNEKNHRCKNKIREFVENEALKNIKPTKWDKTKFIK